MPTPPAATTYLPVVRFDATDVAANRSGHLSARQVEALQASYRARRRASRRAAILELAIVAGLGTAAVVVEVVRPEGSDRERTLIGITVAAGALAMVVMAAIVRRRADGRVLDPPIGVVSGLVGTVVASARSRSGRYMRYEVTVADPRGARLFRLPDEATVRRFHDGETWTIWFAALSPLPVILSGERTG